MELESGSIEIDGINVRKVALETLRKKVTTIPQDPVLFAGTLRFNIDPNESESNEAIDAMLKKAGLDELLKTEKDTPLRDFEIEEGGKNLSAGEK
jgi:ABC-type multidrug transport system fused ATPase/permease subunit